MRIALVSPYSWTYPGGVTRHIEALAHELIAVGHDVSVLAPFDPDDATSRRLHRGAAPEPRAQPPYLISLGRTVGLPANGAVSNVALFPQALITMRQQLRDGAYDVVHLHEPVVPLIGWDALCSTPLEVPLVGTFHTYSDSLLSNGAAALIGAGRRMSRLHVRIAVSEAAEWTARRFFGGRYRIVPNGVRLPDEVRSPDGVRLPDEVRSLDGVRSPDDVRSPDGGMHSPDQVRSPDGKHAQWRGPDGQRPLRILFIGQAVERKGLPVLVKAFEALREDRVPSTLTLVGAEASDIKTLLLDGEGVRALGKVSEEEKARQLAEADVLCAPSLGGESFGMVLTEAFAASLPVIASDIAGYRDVLRDGAEGMLVPAGDPRTLGEALRKLALDPAARAQLAANARKRAERFAWPQVASEVVSAYQDACSIRSPVSQQGARTRAVRRLGLVPADGLPRVPPRRLPSIEPARRRAKTSHALKLGARALLGAAGLAAIAFIVLALLQIGVANVVASVVVSRLWLVGAGLALMCASMAVRGLAWHSILAAAPTWRVVRRIDTLQGTFIGVLMSATLPVRLGETARALIVARRIGRAQHTLRPVLASIVSQTLLNVLALIVLGCASVLGTELLSGKWALLALTIIPLLALAAAMLLFAMLGGAPASKARGSLSGAVRAAAISTLQRVREGLALLAHARGGLVAATIQLGAWGLQLLACWLVLMALGLDTKVGVGGAAAVLFAVNVTALIPIAPANIGVFQAAVVAVLVGGYHVSGSHALAYGIILQAVELATAVVMGLPALLGEGLSWRELRLRTLHAAPVKLRPLWDGSRGEPFIESSRESS